MAFNGVVSADRPPSSPYGLFSVARVQRRGAGDEHWVGGFNVETDVCRNATNLVALCSADGNGTSIIDNNGDSFVPVYPFGILEQYDCDNSIGFNAVDRRATVVRQLELATEYSVEVELWSGIASQADAEATAGGRWLKSASSDLTITGTTAAKPLVALGSLEQLFKITYPGIQPTIHMTARAAEALADQLELVDGHLETQAGSLVAVGSGYTGVGPTDAGGGLDAVTATTEWMYATGPVHVDLGVDELITTSANEIINPVTNAVAYTAERPAAVYFNSCKWFAARVDLAL